MVALVLTDLSRNGAVNSDIFRPPPSGLNRQQLRQWLDGVEEESQPSEHPATT